MQEQDAHLWLQFVHAANSLIDMAGFNRIADQHALFNRLIVDVDVDARFLCKLGSGIAVAFDDEVVEDDAI
jgi:hypothetical protein